MGRHFPGDFAAISTWHSNRAQSLQRYLAHADRVHILFYFGIPSPRLWLSSRIHGATCTDLQRCVPEPRAFGCMPRGTTPFKQTNGAGSRSLSWIRSFGAPPASSYLHFLNIPCYILLSSFVTANLGQALPAHICHFCPPFGHLVWDRERTGGGGVGYGARISPP